MADGDRPAQPATTSSLPTGRSRSGLLRAVANGLATAIVASQSYIARHVWVIGIVLALLTIGAANLIIWDQRQAVLGEAGADVNTLGTVLAEQTLRYVQVIDMLLQEVQARDHDLDIRTQEEFRNRLGGDDIHWYLADRLKKLPQARALVLVGADGVPLNSSQDLAPVRASVADRDYFQYARDHSDGGVFVSEPAARRTTGTLSIFLARRLSAPDGGFLGVAVAVIDVDYLAEFYRSVSRQRPYAVTLLRRDGRVLARNSMAGVTVAAMPAASPWYAKVAAGGGSYRSSGYLTGDPAMVAVNALSDYPLVVDVSIHDQDLLAGWRRQAAYTAASGMVLAVLFVLLFWLIARHLRRQEQHTAELSRTEHALYQAKERAEAAEVLLQDAIDSISEGFVIYDANDRLVIANASYRRLFPSDTPWTPGITFEHLLRHGLARGHYPDAIGREPQWLEAWLHRHRQASCETEQPLADGRWLLVTKRRMRNGGLAGLRIDITDQKQAQMARRRSEMHLERAQEIAGIGSWEMDVATGRSTWSRQLYRIRGLPLDFQPTRENVASASSEEDAQVRAEWFADLAAGRERAPIEIRIRRPDGEFRVLRLEGRAMVEPGGAIRRLVGTAQDVTERRLIELQLVQAQKMEAIGNLTGGLAHDFNNVLGVVMGNLDLLKRLVRDDADASELCDEVLDGAARCADLIQGLLAFARRQPLRPERIDANALVRDTARLLGRSIGEHIALRLDLDPALWPVMADAAQLEAALVNLATNARDAMPRGGRLDISTRNGALDADYAALHPGVDAGDYAMIEISDTGTGIRPDIIGRIFEPFFTTKGPGKGTGLGLAMTFGFVKQSGGHLSVYSEPGLGTRFLIYLPRGGAGETAKAPVSGDGAVPGGNATVLVVEDNAQLRRAAVRQLEELGYRVREAEHADAALAVLSGDAPIDLLFTDMVMPGTMSGLDLALRAVRQRPGLRVLLTSGFPGVRGVDDRMATCPFTLLNKPYRRDELARTVRAVLDQADEILIEAFGKQV